MHECQYVHVKQPKSVPRVSNESASRQTVGARKRSSQARRPVSRAHVDCLATLHQQLSSPSARTGHCEHFSSSCLCHLMVAQCHVKVNEEARRVSCSRGDGEPAPSSCPCHAVVGLRVLKADKSALTLQWYGLRCVVETRKLERRRGCRL